MRGNSGLLLTEAGEKAILKFLDDNKSIFESITDSNLLGSLLKIANERENRQGSKLLTKCQIQGRLERLAKTRFNVSPQELVFLGPTACKKSGDARGKGRQESESDTTTATTPALNSPVITDDEPRVEATDKTTEDDRSFRTDTEPLDDVPVDSVDRPEFPKPSTNLTDEPPLLSQVRHLVKAFEDNWGQTYAPRLQDVQDEMSQIFEGCGTAVGYFVQDMHVQQLKFDQLTNDCNAICQVLVTPLSMVKMEQTLFTIYHQTSLNPTLFLRAVAGVTLFSWVLQDHIRRDSSFREIVSMQVMSTIPEDTHDTENPMPALLQILEELVVPTEGLVQHLATKYTKQLLKVLTAFRDPILQQHHLRADPEFEFLAEYDRAMMAVFERACRLRIMLSRSSPSTYRFTYARSRDRFDRNWMTRIPRDGGIVVENDLVTICLSPAIYGSAGEGEAMRVLYRAMVI